MRDLKKDWGAVRGQFFLAKKRLLIFDFDGTLVGIAKTPDKVFLDKRMGFVLKRLAAEPSNKVVIMSGRPVRELAGILLLRNIFLIGNHGFETKNVSLLPRRPLQQAAKLAPAFSILYRKLKSTVGGWPGVLIENKGLGLSVHYRGLSSERMPLFNELIAFLKKKHCLKPIDWRRGKKVWELRPAVEWDKGLAALHLFRKFRSDFTLVMGDDQTDEDMFNTLKKHAVTVHVGRSRRSLAAYGIKNQSQVIRFLSDLCP